MEQRVRDALRKYKYLVTLAPGTNVGNTDQLWKDSEEQAKSNAFAALASGKYSYLTITQVNTENMASGGHTLFFWSEREGLKVDRRSQIYLDGKFQEMPPMDAHGAYL